MCTKRLKKRTNVSKNYIFHPFPVWEAPFSQKDQNPTLFVQKSRSNYLRLFCDHFFKIRENLINTKGINPHFVLRKTFELLLLLLLLLFVLVWLVGILVQKTESTFQQFQFLFEIIENPGIENLKIRNHTTMLSQESCAWK
jgi:hypothetical protein